MKIKVDKADKVFSQYIRLRDGKCCRCGSWVEKNDKGLPVSHQASHYFGRGREGTRFDPMNVDCLCWGCHQFWGSDNREDYRRFKIKQLGEKELKAMELRSNLYYKKDRNMEWLRAKILLKEVLEKYGS